MKDPQSPYNWNAFSPAEHAVLTFVRRAGSVLLIRKLRGLGKGKINAPGGRVDPGETAAQAATRETREEVGITVGTLTWMAKLDFAFVDGYTLSVDVFLCDDFHGTPGESEEAIPIWVKESEIPYHEMWEDDQHWLPHVLAGQKVRARCLFDGDSMIEDEFRLIE